MEVPAESLIVKKPELIDYAKEYYRKQNKNRNAEAPIAYLKKPDFFFFISDNYSTLIVSNIAYLKDKLIYEFANLMIQIAESFVLIKKGVNFIQNQLDSLIQNHIIKKICDSGLVTIICAIFGIKESDFSIKLVFNAIRNYIKNFKLAKISSIFSQILAIISSKTFLTGFLGIVYGYHCASTKEKLDRERFENYSFVLQYIITYLIYRTDEIAEKNIFIANFDERNFYCVNPFSKYRRNEGSYCEFAYIEDFENSPKAKDIRGGIEIHVLAELCQNIMVSNVNHLHNLKNKLTSTYISTSQIIQRNINDEEENNN